MIRWFWRLGKHVHEWKESNLVIDTYPETYTRSCACGVVQHNWGPNGAWRDVKCCGGKKRETPPR